MALTGFLRAGAFASIAALSLLGGCGSDAACLVDTDCPLFERCAASQCISVALPEGGPPPRRDSGQDPDSGGEDSGPEESRAGTVVVAFTPSAPSCSITASFTRTSMEPDCETASEGACVATLCEGMTAPSTDGGMPSTMVPEAGVITLNGTLLGTAPAITPAAAGVYPPASGTEALWNVDPTMARPALEFQAAGGDRSSAGLEPRPFTLRMDGPAAVTLTAPDFATPVSQTAPLDFVWDQAAGTDVVVVLSSSQMVTTSTTRTVQVSCVYSAGTQGTVPAIAMESLVGDTAAVSVFTRSEDTLENTGFTITGSAITTVANGALTLM